MRYFITKYLQKKCIKGGRIVEKRPISTLFFALEGGYLYKSATQTATQHAKQLYF